MWDKVFRHPLAWADRHPAATDIAIALAFALLGLGTIGPTVVRDGPGVAIVSLLTVVAITAPLAWRRKAPVLALGVQSVAIAVYAFASLPSVFWYGNGWVLAAYSAAVYGLGRWRDPVRATSIALIIVALAYSVVLVPQPVTDPGRMETILIVLANAALVIWVWLFGNETRLRRQREAELAERTRQLEHERESNARRAVLDERVRIARELHDVVAHHVSVMGVQASAARRIMPTRPVRADEAMAAIEVASREAVGDLHRLLGFLRRDADDASLAPQPGLRDLADLLLQMKRVGLPVSLSVEGRERQVPPAVDLSAYRIVQEALTNALRHAGPTTAIVTLRYRTRELEVEVSDRGPAEPWKRPVGQAGGNGIVGMRERAALLGGRLCATPEPDGGFTVRATLPFDGIPS